MTREELIEAILEVFDSTYKPDLRSGVQKKVQNMVWATKKHGVTVQSPDKYKAMLKRLYGRK